MVTGPGFSSPNQPAQERTTAYRDSSGPNSRSDAHCATIVGDWDGRSHLGNPGKDGFGFFLPDLRPFVWRLAASLIFDPIKPGDPP